MNIEGPTFAIGEMEGRGTRATYRPRLLLDGTTGEVDTVTLRADPVADLIVLCRVHGRGRARVSDADHADAPRHPLQRGPGALLLGRGLLRTLPSGEGGLEACKNPERGNRESGEAHQDFHQRVAPLPSHRPHRLLTDVYATKKGCPAHSAGLR